MDIAGFQGLIMLFMEVNDKTNYKLVSRRSAEAGKTISFDWVKLNSTRKLCIRRVV
jgi:hypothetical protein